MQEYWVVVRLRQSPGADAILFGVIVEARTERKATKRAFRKIAEDKPGVEIVGHVSTELRKEKRLRDSGRLYAAMHRG